MFLSFSSLVQNRCTSWTQNRRHSPLKTDANTHSNRVAACGELKDLRKTLRYRLESRKFRAREFNKLQIRGMFERENNLLSNDNPRNDKRRRNENNAIVIKNTVPWKFRIIIGVKLIIKRVNLSFFFSLCLMLDGKLLESTIEVFFFGECASCCCGPEKNAANEEKQDDMNGNLRVFRGGGTQRKLGENLTLFVMDIEPHRRYGSAS